MKDQYKELIVEMISSIDDLDVLVKIYTVVKTCKRLLSERGEDKRNEL